MVFRFSLVLLGLCLEKAFLSEGLDTGCRVKASCQECIQTPGCSWCTNAKGRIPSMRVPGCYGDHEIGDKCQKQFIESPKIENATIKNDPTRDSRQGDAVQMQPQIVRLALPVGKEFTIEIQFRKAEDYPIDLYYLMDFSSSMQKHKNNLSALGNKLAETMKNITSNFQLGFGSFVDKVTLPFTSTVPDQLESPCPNCRSPYSFKNHMSLSRETDRFSLEVKKARMSGNLDTPEGVLDALMQATVCKEQINWRQKARHILVMSTDAEFHLAGDGKLGGIVEPNDGLCHLDKDGYMDGLENDYPSISQINQKIVDNNINVIFAVTPKVKEDYKSLSNAIHGASFGLLERSGNTAELVLAQYEKLSTKIVLTDNAHGPAYVTYSAKCPGEQTWKNTNECLGVRGGAVAYFKSHITVTDCSFASLGYQEIKIKPLGINESLTVQLQTVCNCDCANLKHPDTQINSTECFGSGNLICGQCVCNSGKIGKRCECSGNNAEDLTNTETCKADNMTNLLCSGQGECKCGVCNCRQSKNLNEEITGRYCECDNYSCPKHEGLLCSGNGICKCKECVCNPDWTGEVCDCPLDDKSCRQEANTQVCSGRGDCVCGICHCNNTEDFWYSGKYCQTCMTCRQQCDLYNDCVECLSHGSGPYKENDCLNCTHFSIMFIDDAKGMHSNITTSDLCVATHESGCTFKYIYYYDEEGRVFVYAEKSKTCPEKIDLIAVIAGTTGGTVFIGILLLLIWKLFTTIHDKREYEKFEKERQLARWGRGDNPLYKTAIKTYKNPAYKKDC